MTLRGAGRLQGDYQRAVDLFREVFTLPGSGSMRYKGTLREIRCVLPPPVRAIIARSHIPLVYERRQKKCTPCV